jgi:hypothetical protein
MQDAATPDALRERSSPAIAQLEQQLLGLRQQRNQQYVQLSSEQWREPAHVLGALEADLLLEFVRCDDQIVGFCANRTGQSIAVPVDALPIYFRR